MVSRSLAGIIVRSAAAQRHWQTPYRVQSAAGVHKGSPWLQLLDNRDPPAAQQHQPPGDVKPQPDPATGALPARQHPARCMLRVLRSCQVVSSFVCMWIGIALDASCR